MSDFSLPPVETGGYIKMPTQLLESLYIYPFKQRELKVVAFIIRSTLGFHKKSFPISIKWICKETRIAQPNIGSVLRNLIKLKILNKEGKSLGINLLQDEWLIESENILIQYKVYIKSIYNLYQNNIIEKPKKQKNIIQNIVKVAVEKVPNIIITNIIDSNTSFANNTNVYKLNLEKGEYDLFTAKVKKLFNDNNFNWQKMGSELFFLLTGKNIRWLTNEKKTRILSECYNLLDGEVTWGNYIYKVLQMIAKKGKYEQIQDVYKLSLYLLNRPNEVENFYKDGFNPMKRLLENYVPN